MLIQLVIINLQLDNRKNTARTDVSSLQAELTVGIGEFSRTWAWVEGSWSWGLHRILLRWPNVWGATVTILGGQKQPSVTAPGLGQAAPEPPDQQASDPHAGK